MTFRHWRITVARAYGAFWSPRVPRRACDVTPRDPRAEQSPTPGSYSCLSRWFCCRQACWFSQVKKRAALTPFSYITSVGCTVCILSRPLEDAPGKLLGLAVRLGSCLPWLNSCAQYQAGTQTERFAERHPKPYALTWSSLPSFSSSSFPFFFLFLLF